MFEMLLHYEYCLKHNHVSQIRTRNWQMEYFTHKVRQCGNYVKTYNQRQMFKTIKDQAI